MAWMTCCPSCRTTFRVTPDQLSQAQAWLRCGHCDRVFDGTGLVVNWQGSLHAAEAQEPVVEQDALEPIGFEHAPSAQAKGLWAAALLLLCVLPLLLIMSQRQAVLARWPQLWPAFNQVCALARCDMPALIRAQDVVIDSSSFVPQAEGYALAAVLRNVGAWPVRAPALELTLLDAQEQAVLRRVFTSEQLQFAQELAPEQTVEVRLEFLLDAGPPEVTGYRLRSVQP